MSRTSDKDYQRMRDEALAISDTCWLCGGWIDPELVWPDPMSGSFDHYDPVADGGDNLGPGAASHLDCNRKRQKKPYEQIIRERQPQHGRSW